MTGDQGRAGILLESFAVDKELLFRMQQHLDTFPERREMSQQRMDDFEEQLAAVSRLVQAADGFIKATRIVSSVASVLLVSLISLVVWIAAEKNTDMRTVQAVIQEHSIQIKRTLDVVERMAIAQERDSQRLERHLDSIAEGAKRR